MTFRSLDEVVTAARNAEKRSAWQEAADLWQMAGRSHDRNACEGIAACIELGDAWRELPEPRADFRTFAADYKRGTPLRRLRGAFE